MFLWPIVIFSPAQGALAAIQSIYDDSSESDASTDDANNISPVITSTSIESIMSDTVRIVIVFRCVLFVTVSCRQALGHKQADGQVMTALPFAVINQTVMTIINLLLMQVVIFPSLTMI